MMKTSQNYGHTESALNNNPHLFNNLPNANVVAASRGSSATEQHVHVSVERRHVL